MAPHQDALSALGNIYDGSSDDDESDDEPAAAAASAPAASAPAAAAAAAPVKEALPDAGDLLSDMPDEVDWSARPGPVEEEAPGHDPVGTTYNNVPLPTTMAREQDAHNDVAHSKAGKGKGKPAYKPLRQAPASSKADGALGVSCVLAGRWPWKWPAAACCAQPSPEPAVPLSAPTLDLQAAARISCPRRCAERPGICPILPAQPAAYYGRPWRLVPSARIALPAPASSDPHKPSPCVHLVAALVQPRPNMYPWPPQLMPDPHPQPYGTRRCPESFADP